jgi:C4-dicarboxylate-specific signal transduction histidine kinase
VRHAVTAAGPGAQTSQEPRELLRNVLQAQPELASMNDFLAASAEELGADLIYLRDDQGNCVASSNAGTATSIVGQHMSDPVFFAQTRDHHAARLFAVGHATGIAGMVFSASIYEQGTFIGAVFVKRNTRALAALVGHEGAFVVDAMGVVIMSQDPRLLLRALPGGRVGSLTPAPSPRPTAGSATARAVA